MRKRRFDLCQMKTVTVFLILCIFLGLSAVYAGENWPQFRGTQASGIGNGKNMPVEWDVKNNANVSWKLPIPGLGHSSPVIWEDNVFITTAVGEGNEDPYLRVGLYGESPDHPEDYIHHFKVYCINKKTGKVNWEKTSNSAVPKVKRHIKSSHATCSPATDGRYVVVFFGSEGLYCYNMKGKLAWKKDLGFLDSGAFNATQLQWGFGSSPVIYKDKVIVLCDVNNQSFIAAFNIFNGEELWRTLRDEVPTWGTPTVVEVDGKPQVIVNGWKHIGSYDAETGKEIWKMEGGGDIPVPTPVIAHDMVFITNSHGRVRPIYAISLKSKGDISLDRGQTSNGSVVWSNPRRGGYMPTPLVYGDYLYVLNNNGVLTCYKAKTGEQVYRERTGGARSAYSASPVAAEGKIYFSDEYGKIHVIKAGPEYKLLASNTMDEICMATPAFSGNSLFIRTTKALYAIENKGDKVNKISKPALKAKPKIKKAAFKPPTKELSDPVEVFKNVDLAAKAVESIKYNVTIEGTDALADRVGKGEAGVIATGLLDGNPEKFIVEGKFEGQGGAVKLAFTGGSDGDRYYLIDHSTKTLHSDLTLGVMGSLAQIVMGGIVREFHLDEPFTDEVKSFKNELLGEEMVGDEACYQIKIVYSENQNNVAIWSISKKDYLPRKRVDFYTLRDGSKGTVIKTLTKVVIEPKTKTNTYKMKLPEGYTATDSAHQ